jgi:hypothetical protein
MLGKGPGALMPKFKNDYSRRMAKSKMDLTMR